MAVSSIRSFWQELRGSVNPYIHPKDKPIIDLHPNKFKTQYPPPAFIGDIDHARIILLMNAGGYDPHATPNEFPTPKDVKAHLDWLVGDEEKSPVNLSSYYTAANYYDWIAKREAVVVNACPYRSLVQPKSRLKSIADQPPSTKTHRQWLQEEAIPAAVNGSRLLVFMNWSLWNIDRERIALSSNILFNNPRSINLERRNLAAIETFVGNG